MAYVIKSKPLMYFVKGNFLFKYIFVVIMTMMDTYYFCLIKNMIYK